MTALPELGPVIHAAARLKVVASLAALAQRDRISFPRLQKLLDMTAGREVGTERDKRIASLWV